MIVDQGTNTLIQVDGGVGKSNIKLLNEAGVDVFVVGNTVFSAKDPKGMIEDLKELKTFNHLPQVNNLLTVFLNPVPFSN